MSDAPTTPVASSVDGTRLNLRLFVGPLDNLDGTFDQTVAVVTEADVSLLPQLTDGPFYVFASLPKGVRVNPRTAWSGAAMLSADPAENGAALDSMLANPPPVAPAADAVLWDATNPPA